MVAQPEAGKSEKSALRARWRAWILALPRYQKRVVLAIIDLFLLASALWISISLRYGQYYVPPDWGSAALLASAPLITLFVFWQFGLYRLVTRYISYRGTIQIFMSVGFSVLVWALIVFMSGQLGIPRSVIFSYWALGTLLIAANRQIAGLVLKTAGIAIPVLKPDQPRKHTLIYGAGPMGIELLQAIRRVRDRKVVAFIDESSTMWGQWVNGTKVYAPAKIARLIERDGVQEILLALPGSLRKERRKILQTLEKLPVEVKILPAYEDIASGRVGINDLRPVDVGDLLGRDPVRPSPELLARNTRAKSILVTGAGGSIGSELVRQILRQNPRRLVLLDVSEVALYRIDIEISEAIAHRRSDAPAPELKAVLGSVLDAELMAHVIRSCEIETIYHAAAYKHVPIVEGNPVVGLDNNVFGTSALADCARRFGVERFVLISTDKAVRPTNVMGASKRLAELVLQAAAADQSKTVFTMVRFGNVLDSSGSVVRRFRKQIAAGGPLTVTHPEITRYFMSIPEAAELVIQAGAMASGGEVFVLHMGDPVKIVDLARLMVHLSGLEVKSGTTPDGDIAIEYVGLRPGEKLYEELLIGANTTTTEHPRILRSDEPFLSSAALKHELALLKSAMTARDSTAIEAILLRNVEGFRPDQPVDVEATPFETAWEPTTRTLH